MICELKDRDFEKIRRLVYEKCGINLHEGKKELVSSRLGKRLRAGNFRSFAQYCDHVTTREGTDELVCMIDSLSTNLTYFFREDSHFQRLSTILPGLTDSVVNRVSRKLLIWSAACSTGEEPYSIAIQVLETMKGAPCPVKILATDISTRVLKTAADGIYPANKLQNMSPHILRKYFQRGTGKWDGYGCVKREVRDMVRFKKFNLMATPPPDVLFDVIFCRNVMIYFDRETQNALVNRLYNSLVQGGYFFIGHSESLAGLHQHFKYIEPSVYRK